MQMFGTEKQNQNNKWHQRKWLWKRLYENKFNSNDDFPLNKPLKFHAMTIIIRSVFEEDGKLYPQAFLDDALYECMHKC